MERGDIKWGLNPQSEIVISQANSDWECDKESTYLKDMNDLLNDEIYERLRMDYMEYMADMRESYEMAGGMWE